MRMEVKRTSVMKKCAGKKTYEAGSMGNEKSNNLEGCRGI